VQRAPGFPCALCFLGRKIFVQLGRESVAGMWSFVFVVPANAGIHTPRLAL
jgi:hypothetical protein